MGSLEFSHHTDVGKKRTHNEDSLVAIPPWRDPAFSCQSCFFGVADGMGGHAAGEVASRLAIEGILYWMAHNQITSLSQSHIENAFGEASSRIWSYAQEHQEKKGMGTTLTGILIHGSQALLGHIGDSRCYLLREGKLRQISRDHTLVAEQIRQGKLTPEDAKKHPMRHILSRAMGVREFAEVDTMLLDLAPGDLFLFCTDGVYNWMPDERLEQILGKAEFPQVTRQLVEEAVQVGGDDNATAVMVRIRELPVDIPGRFSLGRVKGLWYDWCNF
ncbi:MAG TPA: protein phosphatase 2C domain-containing protein [Candidatus Ozemobacteraceae bacterium]|nr:protein phosphatase 2C domain-containing protein [Candidatus Ozemobacteraceae bacterium]